MRVLRELSGRPYQVRFRRGYSPLFPTWLRNLLLALGLCLVASAAGAQEPTPAWPEGGPRRAADWVSTSIVAAQLGAEVVADLRAEDRGRALLKSGLRVGGTVALSELAKRLFHRERPDGSDNLSFWSEHTAVSAATSGLSIQVSVPLGTGVGYLRMAANRHHPTDVIVGALVGTLSHMVVK